MNWANLEGVMLILARMVALALTSALAMAESQDSAPAATPAPSRISLVCIGAGAANRQTNGTVSTWNSDGDQAWPNVVGNRSVPFDDQVNLWIEGQDGRIRMPRAMLPPIRGGENGWFKIKAVEVGENEITGSVAVNAFNNPKMRIDRITGAISISGEAGDYSGRCSPYNPENVQRAF
jgi:hypothetical protein